MSMCISAAQARTKSAPRGFQGRLVEILLNSSLRGSCVILHRSLTEDLVEILVRSSLRGPCMKIWQMPCLRGACMKALAGGSWRLLYQDLVRSAPAAAGPFMTSLSASLGGPGMKILVKVACEFLRALEKVRVKSSRCPYTISYRCLWEDLVEILLKSFSRDLCIKILKILCIGACSCI